MKKEQFAQKMMDILNYGALNLSMGIGYKTGLFDVMADIDPMCHGKSDTRFCPWKMQGSIALKILILSTRMQMIDIDAHSNVLNNLDHSIVSFQISSNSDGHTFS